MRSFTILSLLTLCAASGCSNTTEPSKKKTVTSAKPMFACQAPSQNQFNCVEWRGGAYDAAAAKAECSANRGTWAGDACPAEKRVATCKRFVGLPAETHEHWYAGAKTVTAESIGSICVGANTEVVKY